MQATKALVSLRINAQTRLIEPSLLENTISLKNLMRWLNYYNWASFRENLTQQRLRPACASAQSDQRHFYSLFGIQSRYLILKIASGKIVTF